MTHQESTTSNTRIQHGIFTSLIIMVLSCSSANLYMRCRPIGVADNGLNLYCGKSGGKGASPLLRIRAWPVRRLAQPIVARVGRGDQDACDRLMPLVYDELRRLAGHYMRGEPVGHTLQATALVNEVLPPAGSTWSAFSS